MFKRLNITLPEDALARADEFARANRYTRSGLIAAALDAFVGGGPAAQVAREAPVAYGAATSSVATPPATLEQIAPLLRAFFAARGDVEAAWVFGSVARGEAGEMSDVDIAVLLGSGVPNGSDVQLDLMARLPEVLGRSDVDVLVVPRGGVQVAHRSLAEGVRVYGEHSRRAAEAEIRAVTEYWDYEHVRRALEERLAEGLRPYGSR